MLNSDMCMIKDITFNGGGGGEPTCTYQTCGDSPTLATVQDFAGNNGQFVTEYGITSCCLTGQPVNYPRSLLFESALFDNFPVWPPGHLYVT